MFVFVVRVFCWNPRDDGANVYFLQFVCLRSRWEDSSEMGWKLSKFVLRSISFYRRVGQTGDSAQLPGKHLPTALAGWLPRIFNNSGMLRYSVASRPRVAPMNFWEEIPPPIVNKFVLVQNFVELFHEERQEVKKRESNPTGFCCLSHYIIIIFYQVTT